MCTPEAVTLALGEWTRRDILNGALGVAIAQTVAKKTPTKPKRRTLGITYLQDLTHPLTPQFPYIPIPGVTFPFAIEPIATMAKNGVYANKWSLIEHIGTHIDAPSHFVTGQPHLDALRPSDLFVPIRVIDVRESCRKNADYAVTIDDVIAHEKKHGSLPRNGAVFVNSGWGEKATDPKAFLGTDASGTLHFPGVAAETCAFLLAERTVAGVGVDTLSLDIGADKNYAAHKVLFARSKWAIENIADLHKIPPSGATAIIGVPRVPLASGAPIRLLAAWD